MRSSVARLQPVADDSILIVTDVVDMFGLTLVMAATHIWREAFGRIFLLLPAGNGDSTVSPAGEPLALMQDFGGAGLIEPISTDELNGILHAIQPGASVSFTSAAAPYNTNVDEGGRTGLPIATFDLSSSERLKFLRKLVHYCMLAGGPLVWRELQCAFSNNTGEGIASTLLSEGQSASLVDDLYAAIEELRREIRGDFIWRAEEDDLRIRGQERLDRERLGNELRERGRDGAARGAAR